MLRWTDLSQVPAGFGPSVVTLGNFDGVHRGHQAVLRTVVQEATARSASALGASGRPAPTSPVQVSGPATRAVAVTFEPHPVAVLHPERAPAVLTPLERRLELMAETGLDATLVMRFTPELASLTAEEFAVQVFAEALGARALVVGKDTRLGVNNSGDITTLREVGARYGFEVIALEDLSEAPEPTAPAGGGADGRHWSSTRVRALLQDGDASGAADILGRPHRVTGTVVHGHHRGRGLGYPTANLSSGDAGSTGMVPADGVYAGWFERTDLRHSQPQHHDVRLPAAISVGTNPTFDDVTVRTVEAYVLDRTDLDLYGETVAVDFVERLRGMGRFATIEELRAQMADDVTRAREVLAGG